MTQKLDTKATRTLARTIRHHIVQMTHQTKTSHINTSLSITELLTILYNGILHVDPSTHESLDRDRFVLSKNHSCTNLYTVLAKRGFFPLSQLKKFYQNSTHMANHVTHDKIPNIKIST